MMHYYNGYGIGGDFMSFGWIFEIIFWGLIIFAVIMLFNRHKTTDEEEEKYNDTALEILRERYAKGEITKKQLVQMKQDLMEE